MACPYESRDICAIQNSEATVKHRPVRSGSSELSTGLRRDEEETDRQDSRVFCVGPAGFQACKALGIQKGWCNLY